MEVAQYLLNGISKLSVNPGLTAADGLGQNSARPRGVQHQQRHCWKCIPRPPWDLLGDKGQLLAAGVLRGAAFPPGCGHTQSQRRLREADEGPHPRQRDPPPAPELPGQRGGTAATPQPLNRGTGGTRSGSAVRAAQPKGRTQRDMERGTCGGAAG